MKNVYFVATHHHRENVWARFLVTAENEADAQAIIEQTMPETWKFKFCTFICTTSDDPFCKEV